MFRSDWWTYVDMFLWGGPMGASRECDLDNPAEATGPDIFTSDFTPRQLARFRALKRRYRAQVQTKYPPKYPPTNEDINEYVSMGLDERRLGFARWLVAHQRLSEDIADQVVQTPQE